MFRTRRLARPNDPRQSRMIVDGRRSRRQRRFRLVAPIALVAIGLSCGRGADPAQPEANLRPVVLIVVDALRADHLGTYGYERATSPNLDSWAQRGRVFERAWATSPWTLPSFGSILTGRLPSAHGAGIEVGDAANADVEVVAARNFVRLSDAARTIAESLSAAGFVTGAFVANPFLDPRFGLDRGFGYYDHYDTSNADLRPAAEVVDRALAWIDEAGGEPFFLLMHLFDPHLDYDAPAPFRGRFTRAVPGGFELPVRGLWPIRNRVEDLSPQERDFIVAAYDEEVAYVDAELGRFFAELDRRGFLQRMGVVLTADHGEEFFEHGGFEHGHAMHEEVLRVPLIVWGPQVTPGRDRLPVSLLDVAPTILAAAGVGPTGAPTAADAASPGVTMPGVSLWQRTDDAQSADRDIVAERVLYGPDAKTIVNWPYKAILQVDDSTAKLFDLSTDPYERRDLAAQQPDELGRLLGRLSEALAAARAMGDVSEAELDDELLRRLRALGYIR